MLVVVNLANMYIFIGVLPVCVCGHHAHPTGGLRSGVDKLPHMDDVCAI